MPTRFGAQWHAHWLHQRTHSSLLTLRVKSDPLSWCASQRGCPLAHSSFTASPRVRDPSAPPLSKLYLSKKNFIARAARQVSGWLQAQVLTDRCTQGEARLGHPCKCCRVGHASGLLSGVHRGKPDSAIDESAACIRAAVDGHRPPSRQIAQHQDCLGMDLLTDNSGTQALSTGQWAEG